MGGILYSKGWQLFARWSNKVTGSSGVNSFESWTPLHRKYNSSPGLKNRKGRLINGITARSDVNYSHPRHWFSNIFITVVQLDSKYGIKWDGREGEEKRGQEGTNWWKWSNWPNTVQAILAVNCTNSRQLVGGKFCWKMDIGLARNFNFTFLAPFRVASRVWYLWAG